MQEAFAGIFREIPWFPPLLAWALAAGVIVLILTGSAYFIFFYYCCGAFREIEGETDSDEFLQSVEPEETLLTQRLRDREHRVIRSKTTTHAANADA